MQVRSNPQGRKNASSRSSLQGHFALHVSLAHFAHERDCALPHGLCNETGKICTCPHSSFYRNRWLRRICGHLCPADVPARRIESRRKPGKLLLSVREGE